MKTIENAVTDITTIYFDKDGNPEPAIIEPYVPKQVFVVRSNRPEESKERTREYKSHVLLERLILGVVK